MPEREVKILNKLGVHARPAAEIVKAAGKFKSNITIIRDDLEVNAKSIMGVMMLAAEFGAVITLRATGEDAASLTGRASRECALGYAWLLLGSLFWFLRAVFDLALVRRPAVSPNLNIQGLSWFGVGSRVRRRCAAWCVTRSAEPALLRSKPTDRDVARSDLRYQPDTPNGQGPH